MLCVSISHTKKRSSSIMLEENTDVLCNTVIFLPRLHSLSPLARQPRFSSVHTLTSSLSLGQSLLLMTLTMSLTNQHVENVAFLFFSLACTHTHT